MFLTTFNPVVWLVITPLDIYYYIVWGFIIVGWLINFSILNRYDPITQKLEGILINLTYLPLEWIRNFAPKIRSIDTSPFILLLIIYLVENAVLHYYARQVVATPIPGLPTPVSQP